MRSRRAVVTGFLALFLDFVVGRAGVQAREESKSSAPTDLSGVWILNPELSDDAREKMREMVQGREGGGRGGGPGSGGMGGRGGGMGGPGGGMGGPGGRGGEDPREAMRTVFEPAEEIWITQTAREIEVDETYGRLRRLHPNGKKYKTDNGTAEMKVEWKDGLLYVETRRGRGAKTVETWDLSPDGNRLTGRVTLSGGRMPEITLMRVYDRGEEDSE